jgi:uncharacterized membrane protein
MAISPLSVSRSRILSIDFLRGLVMLIMAIDHIRDNFMLGHPDPTDLATTTPALFFTRWITHFCAPVFVFLSGISAYLAGSRRTQRELSLFLIKRGIWLIVVELLVISPAIRVNWDYHTFALQVIWAIGGSMLILGVLIGLRVPVRYIGILGVLLLTGHNLLDYLHSPAIDDSALGKMFFSSTGPNRNDLVSIAPNFAVMIAYALLPWTAVMLIGYSFGTLYRSGSDSAYRKKILAYAGMGALALFIILRSFNLYGDPAPWSRQSSLAYSVISFVNVTKYPCSLMYCSMTIGVALLMLSCTENGTTRVSGVVRVYGSVPFFYYVLHWYLIQSIHILTFFGRGFTRDQIVTPHFPFLFSPPGFGFSLPGVYGVWIGVIVLLYWPCKWFSRYKKTHGGWWLSYL